MKTTKLTNILLIILLIFNVAFLSKWWMGHRKFHHPKKEDVTEATTLIHDRNKGGMFLVKTLGLDTLQQKKLDNILATHFNFMDKYMGICIRNQSVLFNTLKENNDSTTAFHCADSLGIVKVIMEKELYTYLQSIKNICTGEQQKKYDELVNNMSKEFIHHHELQKSEKTNHDSL